MIRRFFLLCGAFLVLTILAYAIPYAWHWTPDAPVCAGTSQRPPTLNARQTSALEAFVEDEGIPGLQFALIDQSGQYRYAELGNATRDARCPMTENHLLYIGSVSKLVTSVTVWQSIQDGRLMLETPIAAPLGLSTFPSDVTVFELLHHTSGAVELTEDPWFLARLLQPLYRFDTATLAQASDWFEEERRGTHRYTNSNYMLLGRLLEQTHEEEYTKIVQRALAQVVPDLRVHWLSGDDAIPRGYDRDVLPWPGFADTTPFRRPYESGGFAAAGLLSDAHSMVRLVDALFSSTRATISADFQDYLLNKVPAKEADSPALFAYGAGVRFWLIEGETWVGHTGTQTGYSGLAFHNLDRNLSVAAFTNMSTFDQAELLRLVTTILE